MAATKPPPGLQIAQILADLSDLNVAEPPAALALVTAHLNVFPNAKRTKRSGKVPLSTSSTSMSMSMSMSTSAQSQRRSGGITPPTASRTLLRHESSGLSADTTDSRYQTPSPGVELDPDLERANVLMRLYESRERLKQQEGGGLARARANVEAVAEKYNRNRDGVGQ